MASRLFRAAEILDMAVQIEQQGIAFYTACREAIDAVEMADLFGDLIGQEEVHAALFARMKEDLADVRLPEGFAGEYERTAASFVRDRVFDSPEAAADRARRLESAVEAVDWAMEFEQKSIDFYTWIKERVRGSEGTAIDRIIREEQHHIGRLRGLRQDLNSGTTK